MRQTRNVLAALLAIGAVAPAAALAADTSSDGYGTVAGRVQEQVAAQAGPDETGPVPPSAERTVNSDSGRLPFTGLDLALIGGAGALLLGMGLTLRRLGQA
jgi:hypothetical protein